MQQRHDRALDENSGERAAVVSLASYYVSKNGFEVRDKFGMVTEREEQRHAEEPPCTGIGGGDSRSNREVEESGRPVDGENRRERGRLILWERCSCDRALMSAVEACALIH